MGDDEQIDGPNVGTCPDWFISDTHFGHAKVIDFCERPFASIAEMDAAIIKNFAERVRPTDVVLWVGDVFLCPVPRALEIMAQLPGRHLVTLGNHDRSASAMTRLGFMAACRELTLHIGGRIVRVAHKPQKVARGEFCMHGHTHGAAVKIDNRIHVGVDAWHFCPASRAEIERLVVSS